MLDKLNLSTSISFKVEMDQEILFQQALKHWEKFIFRTQAVKRCLGQIFRWWKDPLFFFSITSNSWAHLIQTPQKIEENSPFREIKQRKFESQRGDLLKFSGKDNQVVQTQFWIVPKFSISLKRGWGNCPAYGDRHVIFPAPATWRYSLPRPLLLDCKESVLVTLSPTRSPLSCVRLRPKAVKYLPQVWETASTPG